VTAEHPFRQRPNRTLATLAFPVLLSMIAEPITGLVDTAFVKELGSASLGAVGVATVLLSGLLWVFNFLAVGSQTQVAQADGAGDRERAAEIAGLALALAVILGAAVAALVFFAAAPLAELMGATGELRDEAVTYLRVRAAASPFWLVTLVCFGTLRGLQDMRVPMWIAIGVNGLNAGLDPLLIFGAGPIPAFGVGGAAAATAISQAIGGVVSAAIVWRRLGIRRPRAGDLGRLLAIGRDMFIRTGLLTLFLVLATRAATRLGDGEAAAHQAIRQVWMFTALFLDAFAITAQSLVGYFVGAGDVAEARRVAATALRWSIGIGVVLGAGLLAATDAVAWALVPDGAVDLFAGAWVIACVSQPINAVSFATDGIHWGTGDFGFLRTAMIAATGAGAIGLALLSTSLPAVWAVTAGWIAIRAGLGALRVWPGIGAAPLRR
jgi:MATE family multidrug resistance protein